MVLCWLGLVPLESFNGGLGSAWFDLDFEPTLLPFGCADVEIQVFLVTCLWIAWTVDEWEGEAMEISELEGL